MEKTKKRADKKIEIESISLDTILEDLNRLKNESTHKRYLKNGEKEPFIGVTMGDIGKLAKKYKGAYDLALDLFKTGILDGQILASYIVKVDNLKLNEIMEIVKTDTSILVVDKVSSYILAKRKDLMEIKDLLKEETDSKVRRYYWNCEIELIKRRAYSSEEVRKILDFIIENMRESEEIEKWAMNHAFVEIALNYEEYLDEILEISPKLAVYKEMKVSKGCTSAYAPEWIKAVRNR